MASLSSPLFCGFDLSTSSLKITVIDSERNVFLEQAINFDRDLPEYGTSGGTNVDGAVASAPTMMWVAALDLLFSRLHGGSFPFARVAAVSGSGQQHGSVFWKNEAARTLGKLSSSLSLQEQLVDAFAIAQSPVWQDSSTGEECRELERAAGGALYLARITGSSGYERFTGSQIMKVSRNDPAAYAATERISLVSSFLASLLLGKYALIDVADGSGMNLLNIHTKDWDDVLLNACGAALRDKLGHVIQTNTDVGAISEYFVARYGFSKDCRIIAFTGDNPDTLASLKLGLNDIVISLGTSDTLFFPLIAPKPSTEGHVLCHPTRDGAYMAMLVYKNGSLVRESVRDTYFDGKWHDFNKAVRRHPVGCAERTAFLFPAPEITPRAHGVFRFEHGELVDEFFDCTVNARALVESQILSMRSHAKRMGLEDGVGDRRIIITGGGSVNNAIAEVVADVFGANVVRSKLGSGSAALGGALRAHYVLSLNGDRPSSFEQAMDEHEFQEICTGDSGRFEAYSALLPKWENLERKVCDIGRF
ncbi:hypothetical protein HDU86_007739 [Geranomyces michiganensis]|nr:hypothetical protein HDU86_007739 [Geranomyces michiganensis]